MTVLGALRRRSVEDPQVPLSSASLAEWLNGGKTLAGVSVGEQRAYGLTAYYRAIALLSGTMAGLPFKAYRNGTRERVVQRTILDQPCPAVTPFEFWQTMYANACSWGTSYGRIIRNRADLPVEVWPLHPSRVRVEVRNPTDANPWGREFYVDGVDAELTPWEIFEMPYLSPHGKTGIPPLRFASQVLGISVAAEETSARFYGRGARLSGILRVKEPLTKADADRLKEKWRQKVGGVANAGDIAVLDNGAEFQPVAVPPQDAQLLDSRKFGVTEIARLFGIPPHMLGDVEKSTSWGTGIEQQTIAFVQYTLMPWLKLAEQRVTRQLLPGGWTSGAWFAEYSLDGLLRGDSAARAALYHSAITDGWMNRNEVRILENREPVDGLDEFIVPSNMTLISVDGKLVPLSGKGVSDAQPATN